MGVHTDDTITPEAVDYLTRLAEHAEADIEKLPKGSQPFWFREVYKHPCKGDKCMNNPCCEDGVG